MLQHHQQAIMYMLICVSNISMPMPMYYRYAMLTLMYVLSLRSKHLRAYYAYA